MPARPLIATGVPKSGTHFLESIVDASGLWQKTGYRLSVHQAALKNDDGTRINFPGKTAETILKLGPGQYVGGHMAWSQKIEDAILKANALHVMIYRDHAIVSCQ